MIHHLIALVEAKLTLDTLIVLGLLWLTVLIAVGVTYWQLRRQAAAEAKRAGFVEHLLPAATRRHPSARADVIFFVTRHLINLVMVIPAAISAASVGALVHHVLVRLTGAGAAPLLPAAGPWLAIGFTFTMFLAYDFSYYVYHNAQHRVPLLWEIHKVHHSAEVMVGVTMDRIHPLDDLMNHVWDGLIVGMVYGVWLFVMRDPVEVTLYGINIYVLRNILMMDFIRHTHYKLSFGRWLNQLVLCPHWHQLHHSVDPRHYDKNFGLMLSVWDRWFGTLAVPEPGEDFAFGLAHEEHREYRSWLKLYYLPVVKIGRLIGRHWREPVRLLTTRRVASARQEPSRQPRTILKSSP